MSTVPRSDEQVIRFVGVGTRSRDIAVQARVDQLAAEARDTTNRLAIATTARVDQLAAETADEFGGWAA
ncbi:hypothetical protein [Allonocardiopsis opalescens]|uniref:Uncharacterized protein n=1 Tax=Allonocardiopsis opalescens TaxID=1144618 RepID=A0A2T0PSZ5_9ACTN|nr:hypothetical protein [Allonocardiopsis opalescens]PRX92017.1 hypothetical protein CLV72_11290 [Allonocardiopsis opalescens]